MKDQGNEWVELCLKDYLSFMRFNEIVNIDYLLSAGEWRNK